MKLRLIVALLVLLLLTLGAAILVFPGPAFADAATTMLVTTCVPVKGGINFCPLVPVVNDAITATAGMLALATPVLVGLIAKWLYSHGINMSQQAQKVVSDRMSTTIQNGLKYAISGAEVGIQKINIPVSNDAVRVAANYAIAQSPDLLKKAGIDITTEAGQATLIRRITAEAQPTPPALAQAVVVDKGPAAPVDGKG